MFIFAAPFFFGIFCAKKLLFFDFVEDIMKAYERLLKYVEFMTPSDENSTTSPSSECQLALSKYLCEEIKGLGYDDVRNSEYGYVYAKIPATPGYENVTPIGFIAHFDTVSDFCDHPAKPNIIENYDGKDVVLGDSGRTLSVERFPHLQKLKGRTLITTDGTTILGADDKAGIACIMTLLEHLDEQPHGTICVAFTPDEEIGRGTEHFDVENFGAKFAYTLDGDLEGGIEYETFNAATATIKFVGENVHPGSSKDVMINAIRVAMEFDAALPAAERPEHTEGYEGFYHLMHFTGEVGEAKSTYLVRDHDYEILTHRLNTMSLTEKYLNEKYGEGTCQLDIQMGYRNMAEVIRKHPETIEYAKKACDNIGLEYNIKPVRGGTDGSMLSFMGLPCPNLGTGSAAFHGPYEHTTVEGMDKSVDFIKELVKIYAENK